jgi:hypothetical protein
MGCLLETVRGEWTLSNARNKMPGRADLTDSGRERSPRGVVESGLTPNQ